MRSDSHEKKLNKSKSNAVLCVANQISRDREIERMPGSMYMQSQGTLPVGHLRFSRSVLSTKIFLRREKDKTQVQVI